MIWGKNKQPAVAGCVRLFGAIHNMQVVLYLGNDF